MLIKFIWKLLFLAAIAVVPALANDHSGHDLPGATSTTNGVNDREKLWQQIVAKPSQAISVAFDENGRLWMAFIQERNLYISHSDNKGVTRSDPVKINVSPEDILADGETRPKILAHKGIIYVAYTRWLGKPATGDIKFSRSLDGGLSFSAPITINDNKEIISHRFEAMAVNDQGQVFLAWLDKRDQSAAERKKKSYKGAAVYYAVSVDGGTSFRPNVKAADHSCECCRVAMAVDNDGVPVIFWRHIYGKNERDHAMARLDGNSRPVRVSYNRWRVDGCPHHGGALAIASDGTYHFVWFDNAPDRNGLFFAYSTDRGRHFSTPLNFADSAAQAGHPFVLSFGNAVHIVWKEFDGQNALVKGMVSADRGKSWSAPRQLASTAGASDHPFLVSDGARVYLSWNTLKDGFQLIGAE